MGFFRRRVGLIALFAVALGLAAAAVAYADIPGSDGEIHACYQRTEGNLRVIDPADAACRPSENALSWSQSGGGGLAGYEIVSEALYVNVGGSLAFDAEADCPSGKSVLGGGGAAIEWLSTADSRRTDLWRSYPFEAADGSSGWRVTFGPNYSDLSGFAWPEGSELDGTVYAICANVTS